MTDERTSNLSPRSAALIADAQAEITNHLTKAIERTSFSTGS